MLVETETHQGFGLSSSPPVVFPPGYSVVPSTIAGPRVQLRLLSEDLADGLFRLLVQNKDRLAEHFDWAKNPMPSLEVFRVQARKYRQALSQSPGWLYLVFVDDTLAGECDLYWVTPQRGYFSYWISDSFEGRGLVRESVALLSRTVSDLHPVSEFIIEHRSENRRSAAVPRSLGFEAVPGNAGSIRTWIASRDRALSFPAPEALRTVNTVHEHTKGYEVTA